MIESHTLTSLLFRSLWYVENTILGYLATTHSFINQPSAVVPVPYKIVLPSLSQSTKGECRLILLSSINLLAITLICIFKGSSVSKMLKKDIVIAPLPLGLYRRRLSVSSSAHHFWVKNNLNSHCNYT